MGTEEDLTEGTTPAPRSSGLKGRLYCPHQIFSSVLASRTTNLSLAARPVCLPVVATIGPGTLPIVKFTFEMSKKMLVAHATFTRLGAAADVA